jgi:hypothetical protein
VLSKVLGFPTDNDKDADDAVKMVVLGAESRIDWPRRAMLLHVDESKAVRWSLKLMEALEAGVLFPGDASKFASSRQ